MAVSDGLMRFMLKEYTGASNSILVASAGHRQDLL